MEPRTLRECRIALGQSQAAFAALLGVSPESYRTWDTGRRANRGFTRPVFAWVPSIGVSSLIQVGETPQVWQGDLLVSSLMAMRLYRLRVREGRVILAEPIEIGERIRDLEQMRDGTILLWADNARFVELAVVDPSLVE